MHNIFMVVCLFILSCKTNHTPYSLKIEQLETPPGTIQIEKNLFFDKTEITNLSYLEFLHWTLLHYGFNSNEYKEIFPDTSVWSKIKGNYISLNEFYLRHPAYRNYPVVGISYEQARLFSTWRSNRVMEFILIREGVIPFKQNTPKDSIFTIEKYFAGNYYNITPNPYLLYYPEYTLPDSATYYKVALIADSINTKNYKSCKKKCEENQLIDCNGIENKKYKTDTIPYGPDPTNSTICTFCKKDLITHLKANVREMINVKGVFYGNSFKDSCKNEYNICRPDTNLVNCYTGFRNICRYKKWKY